MSMIIIIIENVSRVGGLIVRENVPFLVLQTNQTSFEDKVMILPRLVKLEVLVVALLFLVVVILAPNKIIPPLWRMVNVEHQLIHLRSLKCVMRQPIHPFVGGEHEQMSVCVESGRKIGIR